MHKHIMCTCTVILRDPLMQIQYPTNQNALNMKTTMKGKRLKVEKTPRPMVTAK